MKDIQEWRVECRDGWRWVAFPPENSYSSLDEAKRARDKLKATGRTWRIASRRLTPWRGVKG